MRKTIKRWWRRLGERIMRTDLAALAYMAQTLDRQNSDLREAVEKIANASDASPSRAFARRFLKDYNKRWTDA